MSDVPAVVVEAPPSEPVAAAAADAAVEIARIEAARDVTIAETVAETEQSGHALQSELLAHEADDDEDLAWLRAELAALREQCATNAAGLSALETQIVSLSAQLGELTAGLARLITPPESLPTPPTPSADRVQATVTMPAETALAAEAAGRRDASAADRPAAPPVARVRRWL